MITAILVLFIAVPCCALTRGRVLGYDPSAVDRVNCEAGQTVCDNLRQCVSKDLFCNGYPDCDDGSDEKKPHCYYRYFSCEKHPKRIRSYLRCDGEVDCPDGSDEAGCLTKPPVEPSTTISTATENMGDTTTVSLSSTEGNVTVSSEEWSATTENELSPQPTTTTNSYPNSDDAITAAIGTLLPNTTTKAATLITNSYKENQLERLPDETSTDVPEDITSEEIQGGLLTGSSKWIIITIAFAAGLALIIAAVGHLYIWIWNKSQKQSSGQPSQIPEIVNDDLFRTHSFSSAGSTSRSLRSSDFYFINPSIVVVDSYH